MRKLVEFTKQDQNLLVTITQEGRAELDDLSLKLNISDDDKFLELIEYQLGNGWEKVLPDEIGALTGGLIITDDIERDDTTNTIKSIGRVYWDSTYQIDSLFNSLLLDGDAILKGIDS